MSYFCENTPLPSPHLMSLQTPKPIHTQNPALRTPFTQSRQNLIQTPNTIQQQNVLKQPHPTTSKTPSKHSIFPNQYKATPLQSNSKTPIRHINPTIKTPGQSTSKTPGRNHTDRFIPNRIDPSLALHSINALNQENMTPICSSVTKQYKTTLANNLLGDEINSKILSYKQKPPKSTERHHAHLRSIYTQNKESTNNLMNNCFGAPLFRQIASTPERVLDAPDIWSDYYLNLMDWSSANILAVALSNCIYLWNAETSEIDELCKTTHDDKITSLNWMNDGIHIAISTEGTNAVQLWNVVKKKKLRQMTGHTSRIGALAWNSHLISSGSRDTTIMHSDVRVAQHRVALLQSHEQEVCGLKWSPDGTELASGANDNKCIVWDGMNTTPKHVFADSFACVKAIAWCPWQRHLLATGSGTADRHIRFYNTATGSLKSSVDTGSQVCSLQWSIHEKEILSSHGYENYKLSLWKYSSLVKIADLTGHQDRILHTSMSPCGEIVCSAAADETIRFWKVWNANRPKNAESSDTPILSRFESQTQRRSNTLNIR